MGALRDALLKHRPRESSGAPSANRFAYQRTWALCRLLELHASGGAYVVILEFHDDVLVIDHETEPTSVDFFQVKTSRSAQWTRAKLTAVKKASTEALEVPSPRSILGKLISHWPRFAGHIGSLNVVSNATFNIPLASDPTSADREKFCVNEISTAEFDKVVTAIQTELGADSFDSWDKVFLVRTDLSLGEHEVHALGKFASYFEINHPQLAVQPFFRTVLGEMTRRATNEWAPSDFEDLCRKKGFSRTSFETLLSTATTIGAGAFGEGLANAKTQLQSEGVAFRELVELESGWRRYEIDRLDRANAPAAKVASQVRDAVVAAETLGNWSTLNDLLDESSASLVTAHGEPELPFDSEYVRGALLYEIYARKAGQFATPNPNSSIQKP